MGGLRAYLVDLHAAAAAFEEFSQEAEYEAYEDAVIWAERFRSFAQLIESDSPAEVLRQNIRFGRAYLEMLKDDA